jgi:transcriptional regulator with XRE-family HTH domain
MMKERLLRFLNQQQLSSAKFAEMIGVQPSSVSHILSGRNNPGFDFIQKILLSYPFLNAEWLILGKGDMLKNTDMQGTLFMVNRKEGAETGGHFPGTGQPDGGQQGETSLDFTNVNKNEADYDYKSEKDLIPNVNKDKIIEKIIVLYTDKSFSEYKPS